MRTLPKLTAVFMCGLCAVINSSPLIQWLELYGAFPAAARNPGGFFGTPLLAL